MAPLLRKLHAALVGLRPHSLPSCSPEGLRGGYLNQVPHWREGSLPWHCGGFFLRSSFYLFSSWVDQVYGNPGSSSSSMPLQRGSSCLFTRSMAMKTHVDRKKRDLARREFQLLRRKAKLMKATMSPEERLLWRLKKANRKKTVLLQRLKKYELEQDPEPVHDPELITPEQLQAFKKIGYKNRNYVPVGRRGVYGGVVLNMHMHWKFHETVQVDCHIFKQEDIRTVARQLAVLSGGIVIDVHQSTTIIMYRGRNYKQPKAEMTPPNTLTKRKALFKSKFLQALDGLNTNIRNIEAELQVIRRKQKESVSQTGENDSSKPQQIGKEKVGSIAVAELSEVSSEDDDDGIFSWESADSLDEDELSDDDEFDYKKAEDTHLEKTKANKPICWTSEESARRRGRTDPRVAKELVTAEQKLFKNSQNRHAVHVQDKGLDSSEDDEQHDNNDADLDENLADSDDDNNVESGDDVTDDEFEGGQSSHFGGERHAAKVKEAVSTDDDLEDDVERQSSHCDGKKTAKIKKAASTGKKRKQFRNKKIARFVNDFINEEDEEQHEEFGSEFDDPDDFNDNSKGSNSAGKGTSRGGK